MTPSFKGYTNAIVSAISFGLIPLFTMPLLAIGMPSTSILVYRYGFGCLAMLLLLFVKKTRLTIRFGEFLRILLLSGIYALSSIALIEGYRYLPGGIATVVMFSYPVWTSLISIVFFHEKVSFRTALSILLAIGGVFCLSGMLDGSDGTGSLLGVGFELLSGLCYALYMVLFPKMKIRQMESLKVTFFIFFFAMLILMLYALFTSGRLYPVYNGTQLLNLFLLGLLPTALSNITIIMALKQINSILVAILGAFEPMTAMCVGILVFGEAFTYPIALGFGLIIASVIVLVTQKNKS